MTMLSGSQNSPQELLQTFGARAQSAALPSVAVGHATQLPHSRRSKLEHRMAPQPLHAIHCEPGATPIPLV